MTGLAEASWQVGRWIVNEIIVQILFELVVKTIAAIGRASRRGLQLLVLWTRAALRRLVVVAIMATWAGIPAEGASQRPQETTGPFEGLSAVDGVVTSNDAFGIWLTWRSEHFRIRYPDGRPAFEQRIEGTEDLLVRLAFHCRADGRGEGLIGPAAGTAEMRLPMHPDAPAVRNVLHPMYWVLGATGREYERTSVEVSLPGGAAFRTELVRKRIDYSFPRPDLRVALPAAAVLELFMSGEPAGIRITGRETEARVRFGERSDLAKAARQARAHCAAER